jgi:Ca-activated chloride channel homolog
MFILREYAACLLVVLCIGVFLLVGYGIFLILRAGWRTAARASHSWRALGLCRAHIARIASLISVLLLIVLLRPARANGPAEPQSVQDDGYTIRVSVNQVLLHATVRNSKGTPVSGLTKDNFKIYEDGVLQEIKFFSHDDIPVEAGLIVDNSGSMRPKRAEVITAALAFARASNPQDQMFVVNFNESVSFGLPEDVPFTDQVVRLESALSRVSPHGQTALYDAIAAGLEHLKKGNRDKKVLIVISDGADNASKHDKAQILTMVGQADTIIYTVGLFDEGDPDQRFDVLKQLAKSSGGEAFLPESPKDVMPICGRIAHDLRSQYTLAYVPTNRKVDGTYRTVQVKADAPGRGRVSVRTRAGYAAPSNSQPAGGTHDQSAATLKK